MPGIALRGYGRAYMAKGGKTPAWQRKEGKSESGGLNKKGVASYRAANRRKSFCARMKGMRKRQQSSNNTGQDRLSKSLRKWNC